MDWVDSHCHIGSDDAGQTIDDARAAGVTTLIVVGCDRVSSIGAKRLAAEHDEIEATVGLHPHEARHGVETIVDLIDGETLAIGECGLDYHYDHSPRDVQREAFAAQVALANEHGLPLVIHTREAWGDTFDILGAAGVPNRVVFHCFTGGAEEARRALDLGGFLSFSGIITFKSADDVREAAQLCPEERLLIETDSPYLAPVPHRGRRNRPALLPVIGAHLAELREVSVPDICSTTRRASRLAFGLND
jgi:TatD DNase family protein